MDAHSKERKGAAAPSGIRRNMGLCMADGAGFSLMVALGESYFPAFALAIGLSEVTAGLIVTVPLLMGSVLQLISPMAVYWLNSHRRWVVATAVVQALSFVPLVIASLTGKIPTAAMFLMASIYWAMGMSAGPAWSTWVDAIVPKKLRTRFFARRNRMMQFISLTGFVFSGWFLQQQHKSDNALSAFAAFFAIAGICRFMSARFLALQTERPQLAPIRIIPAQDLVKRLQGRRDGRLLFYFLCVQFAAYTAAPFFSPYMLRDLNLPYDMYTVLVGSSTFAKIIMLGFANRLARRFGLHTLLLACGIAIVPLPALWLLTRDYGMLIIFNMLGGASWGLFELVSFLLLFEAIPQEERTSILTIYNLANASAIVIGSLIGGAILSPEAAGQQSNFLNVFAASTGFRALTLFFLYRVIKAERFFARQGAESTLKESSPIVIKEEAPATVKDGVSPETGKLAS